jgi:hypothetical protein
MFKRERRFDGQLRGFKLRQKEEHFTAPKISLSSFFFLSPCSRSAFLFSLSRSLSLIERREKERIKYMKKK